VGTSLGLVLGTLDGFSDGGCEVVGDALGELAQFPHDLGHSSIRFDQGHRNCGLVAAQEQNLYAPTSTTYTLSTVSSHPVGATDGLDEGCRVGDLLGVEVGPFVGDLEGVAEGLLLGAGTGAREGAFEGVPVGRLLGDAEGDALGASQRPQRALQLALTSTFSAHLESVFTRAAQSQNFLLSVLAM
jgi:hypothetical protein